MNKKKLFIGLGMATSIFFLIIAIYMSQERKEIVPQQVSVILYGNSMDRWESLEQGIRQSAKDYDVEVNFVLMSMEHNKREQLELIQREIDNGAQGILLAANDSKLDLSKIHYPSANYPILCVESGVDLAQVTLVSADNTQMGESLAKAVIAKENEIAKIAIVMDHQQRDSVKERYDAFYKKVSEKFHDFVFWERQAGEKRDIIFIQRELTQEAVDVVVALDNSSLEAVIDATLNLNKKVKIYGIANSDKAVYYLDTRKIKTLVYQDEFSIGYLSLKRVLGHGDYDEKEIKDYIKYHVVEDKNLYLPENQRVLFPFVK